jgi:DNA-binding CsgD family transcriptional regulator
MARYKFSNKASPQKLKSAERAIKALDLRKSGKTYREIADILGISDVRAWQIITKELNKLNDTTQEAATELKRMELERLDAIHKKMAELMDTDGNVGAATVCLRVSERRSKLLGLDAPTKVAPTDPVGLKPYTSDPRDYSDKDLMAIIEGSGKLNGDTNEEESETDS